MRPEKIRQALAEFSVDDLKTFRDIYFVVKRGRSIRSAARDIGKGYPRTITLLSELEESLGLAAKGLSLINRPTSGKVSITFEGDLFYACVESMLRTLDDTCQQLRSGREIIRLMGTDFSVNFFLPQVIHQFVQSYPNVELLIQQDNWWSILDALQAGTIDFGLAFLNEQKTREGIVAERLGSYRRKLLCSQRHRFTHDKPNPKAELIHFRGETILTLTKDLVPSRRIEDFIREEHPGWSKFVYLPSLSHILCWIKHDLGIGISCYDFLEPGDEAMIAEYELGFPEGIDLPFACLYYRRDRQERFAPPISDLMALLRSKLVGS